MADTEYIYLENGNVFPRIIGRRSLLEQFPMSTQELACKWIREAPHLHIYAFRSMDKWCYEVQSLNEGLTYSKHCDGSYENAIEEAILYCVNNNFIIPKPV